MLIASLFTLGQIWNQTKCQYGIAKTNFGVSVKLIGAQ